MPAEARTESEAGVEAFVRYYVELINRASRTLDAAPLREFSNGCADCERIATDYENDKAAGYLYEGGQITITSYEYVTVGTQQGASFLIDSSPLTIVYGDGRPVDGLAFPATTGLASAAEVRWDDSRSSWVMAQFLLGQA